MKRLSGSVFLLDALSGDSDRFQLNPTVSANFPVRHNNGINGMYFDGHVAWKHTELWKASAAAIGGGSVAGNEFLPYN